MLKVMVFLSFAKKLGNKYVQKLMDTATKTGITASKKVAQETAEATGDLFGNKIADKFTSIGKPKEKGNTKETEEIYISPEKRLLMTLDCFECSSTEHTFYFLYIKIEFQEIVNFLDTTFYDKDFPRFITKIWIEVYDQSEGN